MSEHDLTKYYKLIDSIDAPEKDKTRMKNEFCDLDSAIFDLVGPNVFYETVKLTWSMEQYAYRTEGKKENDKRTGLWQNFYETGKVKYEVPYVDGKKHGTYRKYRRNGKLFSEQEFKDNIAHGSYKKYFRGKLVTEGQRTNNLMTGTWILYEPVKTIVTIEESSIELKLYVENILRTNVLFQSDKPPSIKEYHIDGNIVQTDVLSDYCISCINMIQQNRNEAFPDIESYRVPRTTSG